MPKFATSGSLGKVLKGAAGGEIVLPLLRTFLYEPTFPDFEVPIRGMDDGVDRGYDGWFHPSTHPLWTERQLYYYLTDPSALVREPFDAVSSMAVTAGTFWHGFLQTILLHHGVLKANDGKHCQECKNNRAEVPATDLLAGARGHADGDLLIEGASGDLLEIKTMNPAKMARLNDLGKSPTDIKLFMELLPDYYAQAQEYLRMLGRMRTIVVLINPAYPFVMRELHIPYEPAIAGRIRDKYLRVREAVGGQLPIAEPCCGPRSDMAKDCVARQACPVGRM